MPNFVYENARGAIVAASTNKQSLNAKNLAGLGVVSVRAYVAKTDAGAVATLEALNQTISDLRGELAQVQAQVAALSEKEDTVQRMKAAGFTDTDIEKVRQ